MKQVKWKYPKLADNDVHGVSPVNSEYTLCGCAFDGTNTGEPFQDFVETNKKINCSDCVSIITSCKSVKESEIKR